MFDLLVAIRNFTIAVILAWMGFSLAPDADEKKDAPAPAPNNSVIGFQVR